MALPQAYLKQNHRTPSEVADDHLTRLDEPTRKAYALAVVSDRKQTPITTEKALMAVYANAYYLSQYARRALCTRLNSDPVVLGEIAKLRDEQFRPKLMGKIERRANMAAVVRTTIADVLTPEGTLRTDLTPEQQRAIKKVRTRTTGEGDKQETTHEIELFDPLAAGRLDAELDGTLARGGASTLVQVNVNTQESFEQKVQRLIGAEKTEAPLTLPPGPTVNATTTLLDPLLE